MHSGRTEVRYGDKGARTSACSNGYRLQTLDIGCPMWLMRNHVPLSDRVDLTLGPGRWLTVFAYCSARNGAKRSGKVNSIPDRETLAEVAGVLDLVHQGDGVVLEEDGGALRAGQERVFPEAELASPDRLVRRIGVDGQGVHLGGQLVGQQLVDEAVAGEARLAGELRRDHQHAEVALAGPAPARCGRRAGATRRRCRDGWAGGPAPGAPEWLPLPTCACAPFL